MTFFYSQLNHVDRSGYIELPKLKLILFTALWPITAKTNNELTWFFIWFVSGGTVFSFLHAITHSYIGSSELIVLGIGLLRIIPGVSIVINGPLTICAAILWANLAKPLGEKPPKGMDRI